MAKVFISYRRSDTEGYAGRLYDQLLKSFDESDLFMDVDSISPGADFVEVLNRTLAQIDVMLVVIGSTWLTASNAAGLRRLDQPEDWVRLEIVTALQREVTVIPVLIGDAAMPTESELPDNITRTYANCIGIAGERN